MRAPFVSLPVSGFISHVNLPTMPIAFDMSTIDKTQKLTYESSDTYVTLYFLWSHSAGMYSRCYDIFPGAYFIRTPLHVCLFKKKKKTGKLRPE